MRLAGRRGAITALNAVLVILVVIFGGVAAYSLTSQTGSGGTTTTVTAAGGQSTATKTVTQTQSSTAQFVALEALSKQEGGKVTFYSTLDADDWKTYFAPELQKQFPWVSVNFVGVTPADLVSKVTAECQAHNVQGDVVTIAFSVIARLYNQGCIMGWSDPMEQYSGFSAGAIDPNGGYHIYTQNPVGLLYNTNLVKDNSTLPKTWTDLASPTWKGKVCFDDPSVLNVGGDVFAGYSYNMTAASWTSALKSIAANNPILTQSASATFTLVSSGQCAVGISLGSDYLGKGNATSLGFAWPFNPIPIQAGAVGIVKGTAHPYTAMLVTEWFQSYSGQSATLASGRAPALPALLSLAFKGLSVPNYPRIALGGPGIVTNATYFKDTFTNIFGP